MKNLDLFGNEVEVPDPPKGRRKTPTMQEMYGVTVKIRDEAADSLFRASQKLDDAKEFLDSTDHIRDEVRAFLEEAKVKLAEAERIRNGGENECSGGV